MPGRKRSPSNKRKCSPSNKYTRNWSAYNASRRHRKRHLRLLLRELSDCVEQPEQYRGRPRLPLADVIFCLIFKIFTKFDARGFMSDADDAHDIGLLERVPHYNSIARYLQMDILTPVLVRLIELSSLPLVPFESNFAVDATGFSTDRYARWVDERTSKELSRREWVKLHLICGVRTHIVTSAIVCWGHDSRFLGRLVSATARNFKIEEVSADKGYLSGENMRHVLKVGALPFIAFKSNCRLDADYKSTVWKRMLSLFLNERGRFLAHYNKRNNVESVFSSIKANFGDYVRGRTERAQVNEALAKVVCHNLCVLIHAIYDLGITPKFDAVINPDEEAKQETEKLEPVADGRLVAGVVGPVTRLEKDKPKGNTRKRLIVDPNQLGLFSDVREEESTPESQGRLF